MVIVADPNIRECCSLPEVSKFIQFITISESAALKMNVRLAREKFDELQAGSVAASQLSRI